MKMKKELHYKRSDALESAGDMIGLWGGWWTEATADDSTKFDYEDERMQRICWSGELKAIRVSGCRNGMEGLFAWWED